MYKVLIVDDEKFAAEGIRNALDWDSLGVQEVHVALHTKEARRVITENTIDMLICDIEMPDENGLSLVHWVNEHSSHTETLFLTCHSEFAYAKQAVSLGSFDYLLKPVEREELFKVIERMMEHIDEKRRVQQYNAMYQKYHSLWTKQQPVLAERFWQDFLSRRILSFGDFLERSLQDAELPLSPEHAVLPILISVEEWEKPLDDNHVRIMEYALKKAAEETFLENHAGHVLYDYTGVLIALIYAPEPRRSPASIAEWSVKCGSLLEAYRSYFYCKVSCYIGTFTPLQELAGMCDHLKGMERTNLAHPNAVLQYDEAVFAAPVVVSPLTVIDVQEWTHTLMSGNRVKMLSMVDGLVAELERRGDIQRKQMENVVYDITQVTCHFLHMKGIRVNQIPNFSLWTTVQIRSLAQLRTWAFNLTAAAYDAAFARAESDGIIHKAVQYIQDHIEEDISREDVAASVRLNPAYLSRLFKRETEQSLIDFMIETRMNRAKELLNSTEQTVSTIALQLGYSNFSHFAKMFKKQFGVNPHDYRNRSS
ncbi:AraC family transcriptional regulator [Paenibacillus swuensis]|uniref:AraC family transcriptional regulator n=1 Tax=Paenibacillus swuensis TaxID=1178515 RepID=A0A172THG4_9BACL|nr:response regulator [Paenibacillus swuensis]ANE46406.1 AraC family transcriptional regulator [Paenibacillus swuensis]